MKTGNRGLVIFSILFVGAGILFLLWGLGIHVGKWWPVFFTAVGLASFARNPEETANIVFGLLLTGWSIAGIACLHGNELGITHPLPFFIGVSVLWIPVSWILSRIITRRS